jgi:hypothetical protein
MAMMTRGTENTGSEGQGIPQEATRKTATRSERALEGW